ncbi:hypothetical protein TWF696_004944 [Orbilia brochopaga]|uniref:Uncharacterized protein n=1 Tax=Orbilia brochopaga TaxID=3140254 RepID=A0AAV9V5S8_9PEZI
MPTSSSLPFPFKLAIYKNVGDKDWNATYCITFDHHVNPLPIKTYGKNHISLTGFCPGSLRAIKSTIDGLNAHPEIAGTDLSWVIYSVHIDCETWDKEFTIVFQLENRSYWFKKYLQPAGDSPKEEFDTTEDEDEATETWGAENSKTDTWETEESTNETWKTETSANEGWVTCEDDVVVLAPMLDNTTI